MKKDKLYQVSRRRFVKNSASFALGTAFLTKWGTFKSSEEPTLAYQALGTRVGEITTNSAIIWTRLTENETRNNTGLLIPGRAQDYRGKPLPEVLVPVEQLEGACPGIGGYVRLRYGKDEHLKKSKTSAWIEVGQATDFIHKFHLEGLEPASRYYYQSETKLNKGKSPIYRFRGQFRTAPDSNAPSNLRFCLMTCQGYPDRGHPDGHGIYPAMQALQPDFACLTGDLVYYDNDMPRAITPRLARFHWERMFSLPRLREFNSNCGTYWLKDDHDTLDNDSSPGAKMGSLTFTEGQHIFLQQAPLEPQSPNYRTFRWGKDLQIWLTDGRDFRSPNNMPDGPEKTILGKVQKEWLKRTLLESSATWKILISPTPIVGPDRGTKNDNHTNAGFQYEGDELRNWFKINLPDNFLVICGDRHWQYHSVHPITGLHEFSIGAASDEHAGGSPGEDKAYHRFHLVKGGFISVDLKREALKSQLLVRHHDVQGSVVYEWKKERPV